MGVRLLLFAVILSIAIASGTSAAGEDEDLPPVEQGFAISPVPKSRLNLAGKDYAAVGWGSYIVNGLSDCSAYQSFPEFLEKGNPAGSDPAVADPYESTPSRLREGVDQTASTPPSNDCANPAPPQCVHCAILAHQRAAPRRYLLITPAKARSHGIRAQRACAVLKGGAGPIDPLILRCRYICDIRGLRHFVIIVSAHQSICAIRSCSRTEKIQNGETQKKQHL